MKFTDINGKGVVVPFAQIVSVHEAGPSANWHNIRAFVKLSDGRTLEVQESLKEIEVELK